MYLVNCKAVGEIQSVDQRQWVAAQACGQLTIIVANMIHTLHKADNFLAAAAQALISPAVAEFVPAAAVVLAAL